MITNVSLKHADGNFKEAKAATLMKPDTLYKLHGGSSLASFIAYDGYLMFLYENFLSKGVKATEAQSKYKEYPKGTVLTITQTETGI